MLDAGKQNSGTGAGSISIRPFPYPFKAGFAFCNDLDCFTTFAEMKAVHNILNGVGDTPCGPGLGMEVGDSFHFYSVHPEQDDTFSYFRDSSFRPSQDAAGIRAGIASEILDTLHTWGNFSQKGGFYRKHAERALEELDKYNLKVPVWTNHGDIHNFQNIGRSDSLGDVPGKSSVRGDESTVLEYHFDLTRQAGVRYVWIKDLTEIVGQERSLEAGDWITSGVNLGRNALKSLLKHGVGGEASNPQQISNSLIRPVKMRDGATLYQMLRFGSFDKDGSDNLAEILTAATLRRLVEVRGAMMFYTHLGKGRVSPDKPFSAEAYKALSRLAERARDGEVWVTTPGRLCRYIELNGRLKLKSNILNNAVTITCEFKSVGDLDHPELSGLTIYTGDVESCELIIGDQRISMQRNPADYTGKISFSVPLKPIEYCWE